MNDLRLILPHKDYIHSYYEMCKEYHHGQGVANGLHNPDTYLVWRFTLIRTYENYARGIGLPLGFVPVTHYWTLLGDEVVGVGSIRHHLTPGLERFGGHIGYIVKLSRWGTGIGTRQLRLLMDEAAKMGINPALMTCDDKNTASWRVMEKNGAVFQDAIDALVDGKRRLTRRYWVNTAPETGTSNV